MNGALQASPSHVSLELAFQRRMERDPPRPSFAFDAEHTTLDIGYAQLYRLTEADAGTVERDNEHADERPGTQRPRGRCRGPGRVLKHAAYLREREDVRHKRR